MEYKSLTVDTADGVATVTLQGPGKGNALGPDFFREMPDIFASLDAAMCGLGDLRLSRIRVPPKVRNRLMSRQSDYII